jgi:GNAT superfamily N-acetyltransferase
MEKAQIQILEADFKDEAHRAAIPYLLNEYAKDLLGFRKELDDTVLRNLVPGLEAFSSAMVLLAKADETYVGMAICFLGFSSFHARGLLNIHDFLVLKEFRNRGIGKELLKKIESIAKRLNCCKVTLEVQEYNAPARRLYHSFGFIDSFLDKEAGNQMFLTKTYH